MFKLSKTPPPLSKLPGGGGAVVRKMDKAIQRIAQLAFVLLILWIAIYPVDTQPLNNRDLYREFEQPRPRFSKVPVTLRAQNQTFKSKYKQ